MNKMIAILLTLLLFFGILSCNLDGAGIFLTISESTEIADSNLATEPVRDILYKDGDDMYILHRTSVMSADINSSVTNPEWYQYSFKDSLVVTNNKFTPVSEAVFVPGSPNILVYSSAHYDDGLHSDDGFKSVYVSSFTTPNLPPNPSDVVTGLESVKVIDIIFDGSDVYVITYDDETIPTSPEIKIYTIDTSLHTATEQESYSSDFAPQSVHFIDNNGTKYFIIVFFDETKVYINNYVTLTDFSIHTIADTVFQVSDDATKNSPIIGTYAYDGIIYLVTNEGILITTDNFSLFAAVNDDDPSEHMNIVQNVAVFSIPMTVVTKQPPTSEKLLLIGGLTNIYYSDITDIDYSDIPGTAVIPVTFDTTTDAFYSKISSTRILDFYNVPADGNFSLFTATSDKWIWETADEDTASIQLL